MAESGTKEKAPAAAQQRAANDHCTKPVFQLKARGTGLRLRALI